MADLEVLKARVCEEVDRWADQLLALSHEIHAHPELGFEEHLAHDILTATLAEAGMEPQRHAFGLDTAFMAEGGVSGPTIAVLCEYDALPEIGHACGHNVIATAGLGAAIAAAAVAADAGGRVRVLGTPAEEGGGGKISLAEAGAFEGVDAAMMVHPAGADLPAMDVIAVQQLWVDYYGEAAHAAAFPHRGRNALDAAVLGYVNIAALRQHIGPRERIHGIFTKAGERPNIVPEHTAANWYVRAKDVRALERLKARVVACLEAGAAAAGCRMELRWHEITYSDMRDCEPMIELYRENASRLGRALLTPGPAAPVVSGSTDMGNVSYLVPSIHPMIAVSPPNVAIHTPEFARYAGGPEGDRAVLDGAKALAMTVVDLWCRPGALAAARSAFAVV